MKLFVIRHGETIENQAGIMQGHMHGTLTKEGLSQAKKVGLKLKKYKFKHIFSSDLKRCIDTAEIVRSFHPNTPLTFTKELREIHLGEFQGKKRDAVNWDGLGEDVLNRKPKGGESLNELKQRILAFIKELYKNYSKDTLLLVTHSGVLRQIISHFENLHSEYVYKNIPVENASIFEIEVKSGVKGKVLNLENH